VHFFFTASVQADQVRNEVLQSVKEERNTVIPRLTKIICSGITFVSRNTHTDGKGKLLEWPDRSCLLLYVSARIH
jgi:hypothetical protein